MIAASDNDENMCTAPGSRQVSGLCAWHTKVKWPDHGIINFHIGAELFACVSCARHQPGDMKKTYEINSVALADSQQTRPWVFTAVGILLVQD